MIGLLVFGAFHNYYAVGFVHFGYRPMCITKIRAFLDERFAVLTHDCAIRGTRYVSASQAREWPLSAYVRSLCMVQRYHLCMKN